MPLAVRREPFDHSDWIFELKLDGFRALAIIERGTVGLVSRKSHVYRSFDDLCRWLAENVQHDCVLDGELVCPDANGRPQFKDLLDHRRPAFFYAFDIIALDGEDLREKELLERKRILRRILPKTGGRILYTSFVPKRGRDLYRLVCAWDLEGIVAKHRHGTYSSGDRTTWVKVNPHYSQGEGRRELFERRPSRESSRSTTI